jgi:DNA-binding LacI/PurR family transcriptional regulator
LCPLGKCPSRAASDRVEAFIGAQKDHGVEPFIVEMPSWNEVEHQYAVRDKEIIIQALADKKATAIFGNSGGMTSISYEAMADRGVRVPDDCSLIGIDVLETTDEADLITQFICPGVAVGEAAAELLEARITGAGDDRRCILIPPELQEQSSVATI